jgi:outer membrane protein
MKKQLVMAVATASVALSAVGVAAHEQGDIIIRAGIVTVAPDASSDPIILPGIPEGTLANGVDVDDDTQLSIIGTWMMSDNWGVELLAATPFEHDINVVDLGIPAGSTKHLPPTVSLQWYPRGGQQGWQPYLGVGANYTTFFDEKVDPALGAVLGELLGVTSAKLSLDDSFGLSLSAGVDVPLNDNWMLNAGVWYIDIGTTADVNVGFADGSRATVSFDVDIDPWVYNIGIAYKF